MILLQFYQFDIFYFVPPKFGIWIQNFKKTLVIEEVYSNNCTYEWAFFMY